jgi:hypothetical protein
MKQDPFQMLSDMNKTLQEKYRDKPWFRLTIPKGKRKKRAHKKWMKKTGTWNYLRETEKMVSDEIMKPDIQEFIDKRIEEVMIFGHSEMSIEKFLKEREDEN